MIYSKLNRKEREIRLITLQSGAFSDKIECTLQTLSLDNQPQYTALSYCWGDLGDSTLISVDKQEVSVTKSLAVALNYLRNDREDTVMWNDAISINQDDVDEKGWQISLMGDIYAKTTRVWIWLGESADNSDFAMDLIKSSFLINLNDPEYKPDPGVWEASRRLFQRPWWSRLWVVQEAPLPRQAIVNCGRKGVDIEYFVKFRELEQNHYHIIESRVRPMQFGGISPLHTALRDWNRLKASVAQGTEGLYALISKTGGTKCREPVDKIFGLLSMCTRSDRQAIGFDYSVFARQLMVKAVKHFLKAAELSSPLFYLQSHQNDKVLTLPSWVPDYTTEDIEPHILVPFVPGLTVYRAGATNAAWISLDLAGLGIDTLKDPPEKSRENAGKYTGDNVGDFIKEDMDRLYNDEVFDPRMVYGLNSAVARFEGEFLETIILPGLKFDVVSFESATPFIDYYQGTDIEEDRRIKLRRREVTIGACKEWENQVKLLSSETDPYKTTCGYYEVFWRTIIGDRTFSQRGPPEQSWDYAGRFEAWMGRGKEREHDQEYVKPYNDAAVWKCIKRSFLITQKGYLGMGPSRTQIGDVVCVLKGGDVPFVLRDCRDGYWKFVGESYVHGIMDGSFVSQAEKEDIQEFRIR